MKLSSHFLGHLVRSRRSIRVFKDAPVAPETLEAILSMASTAPSNSNTQPWNLDVLRGQAKRSLTEAIMAEQRRTNDVPSRHFPTPMPDDARARQQDFGGIFYAAQGIEIDDTTAKMRQLESNFDFYGAPIGMILSIDGRLLKHSWLDCGLFLQTLMLAASAAGLGTCAQVVFAHHEATIRHELKMPPNRSVICGVALGVPAPEALINNVDYPRRPVSAFCTFRT